MARLKLPLSLLALASSSLLAQTATLPAVQVSGRAAALTLSPFGDLPAPRLPLQAVRIDGERLRELGSQGLAALPTLDASVGESYNSLGYSASLKARGFDIDNRFNLRRDGLPISGETGFDLFNKAALELLKGTSGVQSGVSSPAGLLNLVTKRVEAPLLNLRMDWEQPGTLGLQLDWSQRQQAIGWRVNASRTRLDPWLRDSRGDRQGLALAGEWRASPQTLLEIEFEHTRQEQPTQPGYSLLGDRLPAPSQIDRRRNLNDAAWRLPTRFENRFASLRLSQALPEGWQLTLQAGLQRTETDDRVAFPFGCSDGDAYWADRFCPDGRFDLYDFRSDNERRHGDSLRAVLSGTAGAHRLRLEVLDHRFRARFERQAYNYAGQGSVFGGGLSAPAPELTDENTHRTERNQELAASDHWSLGALDLFAGLRSSRIQRAAVRTDGSRPTDYTRTVTTPWLGASWRLQQGLQLYASLGEGLESEVAPNRSRYLNAGESLLLRSRQREIGLKAGSQKVEWGLTAFDIRREAWTDVGACADAGSCRRQIDGQARHRGLEAQADLRWSGGGLLASAMWLKARREGAQDPGLNGRRPVNVPAQSARLSWRQQLPALAAHWMLQTSLVHEGRRMALPDNQLALPAWWRMDLQLRGMLSERVHASLGVTNATDRAAWKESPLQFGHAYLFPLAPRTVNAALELRL